MLDSRPDDAERGQEHLQGQLYQEQQHAQVRSAVGHRHQQHEEERHLGVLAAEVDEAHCDDLEEHAHDVLVLLRELALVASHKAHHSAHQHQAHQVLVVHEAREGGHPRADADQKRAPAKDHERGNAVDEAHSGEARLLGNEVENHEGNGHSAEHSACDKPREKVELERTAQRCRVAVQQHASEEEEGVRRPPLRLAELHLTALRGVRRHDSDVRLSRL
mmetsp:Transcript_346/g.1207  ORF Transcript_346/g.1207 Transcript_346/m.1207 type:complete len:219 (+) Transcript_346:1032-1688(+)